MCKLIYMNLFVFIRVIYDSTLFKYYESNKEGFADTRLQVMNFKWAVFIV